MILTKEEYEKFQGTLEEINQKGEYLGNLTKFITKHVIKIIWITITMILGGILFFLWGYFNSFKNHQKR